jgi:hypothetical protein
VFYHNDSVLSEISLVRSPAGFSYPLAAAMNAQGRDLEFEGCLGFYGCCFFLL